MDRVGIDFRYANKFAQSQPYTPQRVALATVVRSLTNNRDLVGARQAVARERESATQHTPCSGYCKALTDVYDEFLQFTQEGGQ